MKISLQLIDLSRPRLISAQTKAIVSSANWQYNQTGQQYNQAGVQYGGSDRRQDLGPQLQSISQSL